MATCPPVHWPPHGSPRAAQPSRSPVSSGGSSAVTGHEVAGGTRVLGSSNTNTSQGPLNSRETPGLQRSFADVTTQGSFPLPQSAGPGPVGLCARTPGVVPEGLAAWASLSSVHTILCVRPVSTGPCGGCGPGTDPGKLQGARVLGPPHTGAHQGKVVCAAAGTAFLALPGAAPSGSDVHVCSLQVGVACCYGNSARSIASPALIALANHMLHAPSPCASRE